MFFFGGWALEGRVVLQEILGLLFWGGYNCGEFSFGAIFGPPLRANFTIDKQLFELFFGGFVSPQDAWEQLCLMPMPLEPGSVGKWTQAFKRIKKHYFCTKHKNHVFLNF